MQGKRTRGERRYQDRRHSRRAYQTERAIWNGQSWLAFPASEETVSRRYRKSKAFRDRCRGKRKGAPKLPGSAHKAAFKYRITLLRRRWNRRLADAWLSTVGAGDFVDVELPGGPLVGRRRCARTW